MLLVGRVTLIAAATGGVVLASLSLNILVLLVFVGALWGALVFPVVVSCYWNRVTNQAFTAAVGTALVLFVLALEIVPFVAGVGVFFELVAAVGGGVVIGLMTFDFLGGRAGAGAGALTASALAPVFVEYLRDYTVLLASLTAYGVSALVCHRQPRGPQGVRLRPHLAARPGLPERRSARARPRPPAAGRRRVARRGRLLRPLRH